MRSRGGVFLKAVAAFAVACAVVTAAACAIGYALSSDRRPVVFMSEEATGYARQTLFADARQMAAFTERLQVLAVETRTSVAVTYVERPRVGETLAAATEAAVESLRARLVGSADDYERSMLVIVLMGKPRIFGFVGSGQAGTRVFLRNLSGDPAVHSLNFKHIQVTHGLYLLQSLAIAQEALRPLHAFLEHNPAQWLVVRGLEMATGSLPELPNDTLLALVKTVRVPLARLAANYGVPPIALLLSMLLALALAVKAVEKLAEAWLKRRPWLNTLVWVASRTIPIPVTGTVAVILYGSLENIASLSQMSGQPVLDLFQLGRALPALAVPAWVRWLALPAACVITLGVTVGIGLRLTGGDARKLIAPRSWFSGAWRPLRPVLVCLSLALVLLLPMPFMVALASMEGVMAVALLVTMLIAWTDDLYRFWQALGGHALPAYAPA